MMLDEHICAKPFVKWVGGKTQLLGEVEKSLPGNFDSIEDAVYVEPFVGGGAVLFWILQKYPNISQAVINDINPDLINVYKVIKDTPDALISLLRQYQDSYIGLDDEDRKELYLAKRKIFNQKAVSKEEMAALFIFLNRTCFNGLYRVNSKGEFNVPYGKYANPRICDDANILAVSRLLQKVKILCGDFSDTLQYASAKSLFYFDPPYKPLSETSFFTSYKDFFDRLFETKAMVFDCRSLQQFHFMFYTGEGVCYSPSMESVENLQILGFESGYSSEDALCKLIAANGWITDCMYATEKILSRRMA